MAEDTPVTLLAEIAEASKPARQQCTVCMWLEGRDDRDDFAKALAGRGVYTGSAIFKSMAKRGYAGQLGSVERHRRQEHQ